MLCTNILMLPNSRHRSFLRMRSPAFSQPPPQPDRCLANHCDSETAATTLVSDTTPHRTMLDAALQFVEIDVDADAPANVDVNPQLEVWKQ